MKVLSWISVMMLIIIAMFVTTVRDEGTHTLDSVQGNLSTLQTIDDIFINGSLEFQNPYRANFTFKEFVINTAHIVGYPIIKEVHNVIGAATTWIWKEVTVNRVKTTVNILLSVLFVWLALKFVKPIGIVYVIVDEHFEKKGKKLNPWIIVLIASTIVFLIAGAIVGLILLL